MDVSTLQKAVRKIVVTATGITPATDLHLEGTVFNPKGKSFFIEEFLIGGDNDILTSIRSHYAAFLIQYDFCAPAGSGMSVIENKAALAESALAPGTMIGGAMVKKTKIERSNSSDFNSVQLLITISE